MSQLTLDDAVERPNPNAHMLDREGHPRRLMWCSDSARLGRGCPYLGERARFRPAGGCCVELVGLRSAITRSSISSCDKAAS